MTESQVERILDRLGTNPALKALLLCSCLGYIVDALDNGLIGYAMPVMSAQLHIDSVYAGYIFSAGMWGGVLGQFAWGWLAEKRGRLFALKGTILTFASFTGLTALAWSPWIVFVARFLTGAGLTGFVPVDTVMVSECAPTDRRGKFTGLIAVLWPAGAMLGLSISLYILPRFSWRWLFVLGAVPAVLVLLVQRKVPESPRWLISKDRIEDALLSLRKFGATDPLIREEMQIASAGNTEAHRGTVSDLISPKRIRHTVTAFCLWFANLYASMSLIVWLPSLLVQVHHFSLVKSLFYTLVTTTSGLLGRIVGVYLLGRMGRKPALGIPLFFSAISMLAFGFVTNQYLVLGVSMLLYFFNEQSGVCQMAYIPELFPTWLRMQGTAWCSALARLLAAAAPIAVGHLLAANRYSLIFVMFAFSMLIPLIIFIVWGPETKGKGLAEINL
jgi:putative MFS transporter